MVEGEDPLVPAEPSARAAPARLDEMANWADLLPISMFDEDEAA